MTQLAVRQVQPGTLPANIKPGDIGLVGRQPGRNVLDRFFETNIEFWTNSDIDHAFIYVGHGRIVEAIRRISNSPVTNYGNIFWSTGRLPAIDTATDAQRGQAVAYAFSRVGEGYNIAGLLAVGLYQRRAGHLVDGDEWWVRLLNADHMDFCSELVAKCWLAAGIELCKTQLPITISPGELYSLYTP
jgi:hypothetical protein